MLSLAALLSKGVQLPFEDEEEHTEPITVIYQTTEDDADDTVVPRFNAAGGDGDRLIFIKEDEKSLTFAMTGIAGLAFGLATGSEVLKMISTGLCDYIRS